MTDTGQTDLGGFGDAGDETEKTQRDVAAEARAVAGPGHDTDRVVDPGREALPEAEGTVEMTVTQVDYTVVGSGREERPVVHVFGRTADRKEEHVKVLGFRPYFYAPTETLTDEKLDRDRITGWEETDENGQPYESIRGEHLTKIFAQTPRDVGRMRDEFDHYEADILFPNRLLIDKDIRGAVRVPERRGDDGAIVVSHTEVEPGDVSAAPRVLTLDIEVDDRRGFPEDGEEPIVCMTTHDSYDDEYVLWLYEAPDWDGSAGVGDDAARGTATDGGTAGTDDRGGAGPEPDADLDLRLADYEPIRGEIDVDVRTFGDEAVMLDALATYVEEKDQDVLTGWNCLPADSEVLMADGNTREIADVEVGERVVGSADRTTTVAEVTDKWRSDKEVLEFDLNDGTSLRSSEEHRIMVGDDEAVEWTEATDVEPGDYVLKPRKLSVEDSSVPHLTDLIPDENQRFKHRSTVAEFKDRLPYGAVTELADEVGLATGSMYNQRPDTWTPERCERASEMYGVSVPDGGRVYRRTGTDLDRELTKEEVYLAGLVLADGTMSTNGGVRFYNTREELHDQFPGETHLEPDGKGCYKQNVLDVVRMYAFNGLGIPFGDENDTEIDLSSVYRMPEERIARFLAGVIDGDGSVSSTVTVAAENESLGDWYVRLFKRLGVYAECNGNVVRVPGAERDIETLKQRVLPHMSHSDKVAEVRSLSGGKSGRSEDIPYALFEAATGSDAERIGRDKHRRGISLKRHETDVEEWEDYVFVEVESAESVGTETTYDVETTTHNFVAEDCLVHNCDDFDMPYLLDRMEEIDPASDHDLSVEQLSRVDEVWRSGWGGPDVKGRVVFDLLYAYKRTQFTELESYRLDAVGEMELDVGKERYPGDIGDLWEDDPERLLEYNLRDVELCVEIDREQDVIPFWMEVASFVGCLLEDAPTPGDAVDLYVLHEAHGEFALPSKGQQESEEFEGGAVFDPISGVRENVSVLDLKCFSGDTDVLTPEGVQNIRQLEAGDPVYTLDPETFECEVKPVAETHEYHNRYGELHHLSGNTHDFKITENHRLLFSKERGWDDQTPDDFQFSEYRDVPENERFAFPTHEPMDGAVRDEFRLYEHVEGGHAVVYAHDGLTAFLEADEYHRAMVVTILQQRRDAIESIIQDKFSR